MRKLLLSLMLIAATTFVHGQLNMQIPKVIEDNPVWNAKLMAVSDSIKQLMKNTQESYSKLQADNYFSDDFKRKDALKIMEIEQGKLFDLICRNILYNINNPVGEFLLMTYYQNIPLNQIDDLLKQFSENQIKGKILDVKKHVDLMKSIQPGHPFVDFSSSTPDGRVVKLSDEVKRNKVTLLDFWASWCGPCKAEMPYVIEAYKNYKEKGFGVIGISLDNNANKWTKAIEDWGMPWVHVSDLNGWKSKGATLYGIHAIPSSYLIGQDGIIIVINLRGEDLSNKLKELLN